MNATIQAPAVGSRLALKWVVVLLTAVAAIGGAWWLTIRWFVPDWDRGDMWVGVTGALAAMSCALPGAFLVLRRQSMMGDALSHTTLPGIVIAFLATHWLERQGWISAASQGGVRHVVVLVGAVVLGVFSAMMTEWVRQLGRVESSASLGVVFTSLFALGLLLVRVAAAQVHLDPECVLYGQVETTAVGESGMPRAARVVAVMLGLNLLLVALFYKELKICAFDPALAATLGIPARGLHYALMAVTAATVVAAFDIVGSILVIAMLITPPATAFLLAERLGPMLGLSLLLAGAAAIGGHLASIVMPPLVFPRLGYPDVEDASSAGMMAVTSGLMFFLAMLLAPRRGLVSQGVARLRLRIRIAAEDILGLLYRGEESAPGSLAVPRLLMEHVAGGGSFVRRWALRRLERTGQVAREGASVHLTEEGRRVASRLVRAHRLWESYMARHFDLPGDHLHDTAALVEHFLDAELQGELADELDTPRRDPHGQTIP